jgi:hypothetical protein
VPHEIGDAGDDSASGSAGEESVGGSAGEDSAGGSAGEDGFSGSAGEESVGGSAGEDSAGGSDEHGAGGAAGALIELPQSGLLLWLRADRGIQQKDGHVQVWEDQSGEHMNATQTSVNLRPAYLPTGFNGRPTLEFDGLGQFLKFGDGFGDFSKGLSGLIVAKPTKAECAAMLELSNGSEIDDIMLGVDQKKWAYEVEDASIETGNVDLETFSLYGAIHRLGVASELRINGSVLSTLDMPVPTVPASGIRVNNFVGHTLYAGNCGYFQGQISEIILYSRTLMNSELSAIEKYLDAHWVLSDQGSPAP